MSLGGQLTFLESMSTGCFDGGQMHCKARSRRAVIMSFQKPAGRGVFLFLLKDEEGFDELQGYFL